MNNVVALQWNLTPIFCDLFHEFMCLLANGPSFLGPFLFLMKLTSREGLLVKQLDSYSLLDVHLR